MYDYLNELNEAQKEAVVNYKGASLVIAGAGSGKTRVLTYRITHLLSQGVPAYKILSLTFTNKAAAESAVKGIIRKNKLGSDAKFTFSIKKEKRTFRYTYENEKLNAHHGR